METKLLSEGLFINKIFFSYFGFMDNKVLTQILKTVKSKLESNGETIMVTKRVYNTINECVENIIKHNFYPANNIINFKTLFAVSINDNGYIINTVNVVNESQKENIHKNLDFLKLKTREELSALKLQVMSNNNYTEALTAGLGFIDLILKADEYNYSFKDVEEKTLFNISFRIKNTK